MFQIKQAITEYKSFQEKVKRVAELHFQTIQKYNNVSISEINKNSAD